MRLGDNSPHGFPKMDIPRAQSLVSPKLSSPHPHGSSNAPRSPKSSTKELDVQISLKSKLYWNEQTLITMTQTDQIDG